MSALFFYGTLRHIPLLETVLGRALAPNTAHVATVQDARASWVQDQPYPMITLGQGGSAEGLLVEELSEADVARITFYEGGFGYDLTDVDTSAGPGAVFVPGSEVGPEGAPFDLDDWVTRFSVSAVIGAREIMEYYGSRSAAEVSAIAHRVRSRSDAIARGNATEPTEFDGKVQVHAADTPYSEFFAVRRQTLQLQTFDGAMSETMERAVFWAADAALLLPYDPVRDRVMLIEQARIGPIVRGDGRVWQLEPVGGMVDPGEDPDTTAVRETQEEAGLTVLRLETIAHGFPTPATSSEYYYCYLGITDIPDGSEGITGLVSEHENIRTHILTFETFMEYVTSNRICATPLQMMGYWLAYHRDRLRAT